MGLIKVTTKISNRSRHISSSNLRVRAKVKLAAKHREPREDTERHREQPMRFEEDQGWRVV